MSDGKTQVCPECGRPLYRDRPSCMYCGYERPLDDASKIRMKKNLVARTLGTAETDEPVEAAAPGEVAPVMEMKCPDCGAPATGGKKFCSSCGSKISVRVATGENKAAEQKPEETPGASARLKQFKLFRSFSPDFSRDIGDYLTSDNLLYVAAAFFVVISMLFPFGEVPAGTSYRAARIAIEIPYPFVLKLLFIYAFILIVIDVFRIIEVIETQKVFIAIEIIHVLTCVIAASEIFRIPGAIVTFGLIFAALHIWVGRLSRRATLEDFWGVCVVFSSLMIILITPYIRTIMMSDTPPGIFANYGFLIHLIAAFCLLGGAIIRGRRIVVIE